MKFFSNIYRLIVVVIIACFLTGKISAQHYSILVSLDGFRWDYANRGITPTLDSIASNGVSALSLQPSFPTKTYPNHYTIVTGLYPQNHGIIANNMYDPVYKEYFSLGNRSAVENSRWYKGEAIWETAKKFGLKTASFFWPGSEVDIEHRRPDYYHKYDHDKPYGERIDGVIEWLKLPYEKRPKFLTLYFDATDTYGHKYGPDSKEINSTIMKLDSLLNTLLIKLDSIGLKDSTNIIIVSDHGMMNVSNDRIIRLDDFLSGFEFISVEDGPFMFIYPQNFDIQEMYSILSKNEKNYRVYKKDELPDHYHLSASHLLPEIILIAEPGWSIIKPGTKKDDKIKISPGNHGFDNFHTDMHGIFYAMGPSLKNNYKTGTVLNIDIYPLLCKILNIKPKKNIDGRLDRIQAILKD